MSVEPLESQTYLPQEQEQVAKVASFLRAHQHRTGQRLERRYLLVGSDEHEQIEIPEALHRVLVQAATALQAGRAVTISPTAPKLTTQQAAELLGVSRPTVIRLIDQGELASERIGNRRKLLLEDVLEYRDARRQRQYQAIADTTGDVGEEEDPAVVEERLRRVRADRAEHRRQVGRL